MPLKRIETKRRKPLAVTAEAYRIPLQVRKVIQFKGGHSYPVCPRCDCSLDREYMRYCDRCGQHLAWGCFGKARILYAPRFLIKCRKTEKPDTMQEGDKEYMR
jgi:ssDNA-binding Zn-finger/Zn-ribbon topoisomerase 1